MPETPKTNRNQHEEARCAKLITKNSFVLEVLTEELRNTFECNEFGKISIRKKGCTSLIRNYFKKECQIIFLNNHTKNKIKSSAKCKLEGCNAKYRFSSRCTIDEIITTTDMTITFDVDQVGIACHDKSKRVKMELSGVARKKKQEELQNKGYDYGQFQQNQHRFLESNDENKMFMLPFSLNVHHKALSDLSKSLKTQLHPFLELEIKMKTFQAATSIDESTKKKTA